MRGRSNRFVVMIGAMALAIGLALTGSAFAADGDEKIWSGIISIPGVEFDFSVTLIPADDGSYSGTLDIPMQGITGAAIGEIVVTETTLDFTLPMPGMQANAVPVFDLDIDASGMKAVGIMMQAGATFPVALELKSAQAIAAAAAARRPQTPIGPFPYREELVQVPVVLNGEFAHMLAGTLSMPDPEEFGAGPYACAILLTGSGPQDRDETIFEHKPFAVIADALARAGVASLRCDERGVGESGGDFATADSYDFANDALAQVNFAMGRPEIDNERIGLIGHSEGGLTSAMVASEQPDGVSFVVSLAGMALTGRETLLTQSSAMMRVGGATEEFTDRNRELAGAFYDLVIAGAGDAEQFEGMKALVVHQMGAQVTNISQAELDNNVRQHMSVFGTPWMKELLVIDPAEYLRKTQQPILVMNGELDLQVLPDENIEVIAAALDTAGNEDVTVHRLPGLNHLFQNAQTGAMAEYAMIKETFDPGALEILVGWVVEQTSR
jgi:pimeloyl-ACP methyl ester carboxylesterase